MAAWLEWSWGHGICSSLPGEVCLWGVAVELAGVRGTFLGVPVLLLSRPWEWQVLYPLPGSKGKVHLFQLLEGEGRACGAAPSPSLLPALGAHMHFVAVILFFFFFFKSGVLFLLAGWLLASFQLISSCLSAAPGPAWVSQLRSVHWWGEHVSCMFKGPRLCTPISPTWRADPSVGCGEPGWGCPCFLSLDASARPRIWVLVLCSLQEQDRRIPRVPWGIKGCRSCSCRSLALGCCFLWRGGWAAVGMPGVQCSCSLGLSGVSVCHLDCVTDPQLDRAS